MTPLFIDKPGINIQLQNQTLKLDGKTIPLRLIDVVVIAVQAELDSKLLLKLTKEGIIVLLLNPTNYECTLVHTGEVKNADLKLAQYAALNDRLKIAKAIIEAKILNHANHLKSHEVDLDVAPHLDSLKSAQSVESLLGIEGTYSRSYFQHYFPLIPRKFHHGKRSKRPPLDPVNALLSYLYSMMYHLIHAKLLTQGYEPGIGYLHTPFRGHSALASDMSELFRHHINEFVLKAFQSQVVSINDFYKKEGVYLNYEGRKKLYAPIKELWAFIEKELNPALAWLRSQICQTHP